MTPPSLDQDYAYYENRGGGNGNGGQEPQGTIAPVGTPPRGGGGGVVQKGLGARSMMQHQQRPPPTTQVEGRSSSSSPPSDHVQHRPDPPRDGTTTSAVVTPPPPPAGSSSEPHQNYNNNHVYNDGRQHHTTDIDDAVTAPTVAETSGVASSDGGDQEEEAEDALLDLEQLEELQHEAERMKALGNKHMAAQEYTRAYNAYSAALQLSPVGPSSHVFLSNRSAALLSLKRYTAAATDARRAIALAPTFGKAHARLGQSLYFLKEYEGAVHAYEDAIHYEPDNPITQTYLDKARTKLQRQQEKVLRQQEQQAAACGSGHTRGTAAGEDNTTVVTAESSVQQTVVNSVVTDPNGANAVVQSAGFRGQSRAMVNAVNGGVGGGSGNTRKLATLNEATLDEHLAEGKDGDDDLDDVLGEYPEDDPDFDEALRIQERANRYLANKNYKYAIEEYTAALFLVPDDENLSPELHLGRAHALNGSRRHESAKIDSQLAIRIKPTPEAFSTLAKSLFYMRDYAGAVDAFHKCKDALPEGEELSMFDRAYLQKAEAAMQEELENGNIPDTAASKRMGSTAPIPKLKPPKFVSRQEAMNRTPNMPAMPNNWPQQSPRDSQFMKYGEEREVTFLSEALGIKLNRGPDGVVRVIDVSPDVPGSPIVREGTIEIGDVIREASGVDLRRPITNIMWGDTVALLKMAPRPIVLVVAKEESRLSIVDQRMQAAAQALSPTPAAQAYPSNSSTEESVRDQMERQKEQQQQMAHTSGNESPSVLEPSTQVGINDESLEVDDEKKCEGGEPENDEMEATVENPDSTGEAEEKNPGQSINNELRMTAEEGATASVESVSGQDSSAAPPAPTNKSLLDEEEDKVFDAETPSEADTCVINDSNHTAEPLPEINMTLLDSRDEEAQVLNGAEIIFERKEDPKFHGWDNLRWMAFSGDRKIVACEPAYRYIQGNKKSWFGGNEDQYVPRKVATYENPSLILILREVHDQTEFQQLMELPSNAFVSATDMKSHLFVESVVDPKLAKLRLSQLTTITSISGNNPNESMRRRSCFTLINPVDEIILSAVRIRERMGDDSFSDSGAYLEVSGVEHTLTSSLCKAHNPKPEEETSLDLSWKHQVILGTLHSFVVTGSNFLDAAIEEALRHDRGRDSTNPSFLNRRVVDAIDESGKTALHYACDARSSAAVASLVKVGATVDIRSDPYDMTPCHQCAKHLDYKSLSSILEVNRRPNVLDSLGRTPIYLAIAQGRKVGSIPDPQDLDQCLTVMEKFGAEVGHLNGYSHPISLLASRWQSRELSVVLWHCNFRYPLEAANRIYEGMSIGSMYHYPIHSALISLMKKIQSSSQEGETGVQSLWEECAKADDSLSKTLKTLLSCGFEANERLESIIEDFPEKDSMLEYVGFAPIQILGACTAEINKQKDVIGEALHAGILDLLIGLSEILVRNGARLSLDTPPLKRPDRKNNDYAEGSCCPVDRSALKISSNKEIMSSVFGTEKIIAAQKYFKDIQPAIVSANTFTFHTDKAPIEDVLAPGGSDEKSCSICWVSFGMMTRKHRCRITRRYVCDACSSHRISCDGEEHRVSDGQFVLAKEQELRAIESKFKKAVIAERNAHQQQRQSFQSGTSQRGSGAAGSGKAPTPAAVRQQRMEQEEAANRDSLFGGLMSSMAKTLSGVTDESTSTGAAASSGGDLNNATDDGVAGLNSQLNQTRDKLVERGEKLSGLADKSDKLVQASQDFASMAKELNRKSNQGFFSW